MYHSSLFGDITHHIHFVHPYSPHVEKHLHFKLSSCENEKTIRNSEKLFRILEYLIFSDRNELRLAQLIKPNKEHKNSSYSKHVNNETILLIVTIVAVT